MWYILVSVGSKFPLMVYLCILFNSVKISNFKLKVSHVIIYITSNIEGLTNMDKNSSKN